MILTTVLFVFPPDLPVTGSNMSKPSIHLYPTAPPLPQTFLLFKILISDIDYCIVVFFIILVISIVQWFVDGKKNFSGPRVNIEQLQNGMVIGMEPEMVSAGESKYKDEGESG